MLRSWIILLFLPVALAAQEKKSVKPGWRTITAAGFTAGESGTGAVFQLSGGLSYGSFFTGIGMGYDAYQYKSFPVFADWRMSFGNRKLMYVYAMPGYTIPGKFTREINGWRNTDEKVTGGFYIDAGLGYRVPLGWRHRLNFSAGYVRKSITHRKAYTYNCGVQPCPNNGPDIYQYRYNYGLLTTKVSWEWGR